jgi:ATP-dependent DNA helicase RecQ
MPEDAKAIAMAKLDKIFDYCTSGACRHKEILRYFGQDLDKDDCKGCDICLGELDCMEDSLTTAQKILSCIIRIEERFGGDYTASVLTGSKDKRVVENGHDSLSTYALLSEHSKHAVRDWIGQLVGQGYIRKLGEYNVLHVTEKGWEVLRGKGLPRLFKPTRKEAKVSAASTDSWEGVDKGLFEALRKLRASIAQEKGVPAFVVFSDATLRDMAAKRPSNLDAMLAIKGVGLKKRDQYGQAMLETILAYCRGHSLQTDMPADPKLFRGRLSTSYNRSVISPSKQAALDLFKQGHSIKQVAAAIGRAESTTEQYLVDHIEREKIDDPHGWVDKETAGRVIAAAQAVGGRKLKPIYDYLGGQIGYGSIRISLACHRNSR